MTLDARIRITAETAQAAKAMRELKAEGQGVQAALAPTSGKKPFEDAAAGAAAAKAEATAAIAAARAQKTASDATAASLRQARNEARQLGPQITDIAVGLATGQAPLMVLLQQGGQLKDVFGGVGNALRAVLSVFTIARVIGGGLITIIAALVYNAARYRLEQDALNKSLALTGNIAGTTEGKLKAMAVVISADQKAAIGDVRELLAGLVATGEFTATSLRSAGAAAAAYQKVTGATSEETIKQFSGMGDSVTGWAEKANRAYNFLDVATYRNIRSLQAQGKTQEAMKVTLDAMTGAIENRAAPAVGYWTQRWNELKSAISFVNDALARFAADTTVEEKLARVQKKIADAAKANNAFAKLGIPDLRDQEAGLQELLRLTNRSATLQGERAAAVQDEIKKESKAGQDAQTQIALAGVQQRLAASLAALDREQTAVEIAHARGLSGERDFNLAMNVLESRRLQAQAAALEQQKKIEAGRTVATPEDTAARTASVKQLEAQLVEVRSRIAVAAGQGRVIVEADALDRARQRAAEWAQIWQTAYAKVRELANENATTAAASITDPIARAAAETEARTEQIRRELADLKRDLSLQISLTIDPSQRAELERQLAAVEEQGAKALSNRVRVETFASLQAQFSELDQALQLAEQRLAIAVEQGALTSEEAERRKFAARAQSLPQLETILRSMQAIASTAAERNAIEGLIQEVQKLRGEASELDRAFRGSATSALTQFFNDTSTGAKTTKDALLDMVGSFTKAMLNVLNQRLAERLVKQFEDSVGKSGGGFLGFLAGLFGGGSSGGSFTGTDIALAYHSGGVAGVGGVRRRVPAEAFAFAPRYHSGGIAGLASNEVPAILEQGERILTKRQQRELGATVGDINIGVTVSGAGGTEGDKAAFGDDLAQRIKAVTLDAIAEQKRQGGLLATAN